MKSDLIKITTEIDGVTKEQEYKYNSPVTLAIENVTNSKGETFVGWAIDGKIVSRDTTYRFFAYKDVTVTAEFAAEAVEEEVIVTLDTTTTKKPEATTYNAIFMVTRDVPDNENYVFVSSGLLLTQSEEYKDEKVLTFETQTEHTDKIRLYRTVHTGNTGQYQLTVKTSIDKTFYARGYVVYLDVKTGELVTLYTEVQEATAPNDENNTSD